MFIKLPHRLNNTCFLYLSHPKSFQYTVCQSKFNRHCWPLNKQTLQLIQLLFCLLADVIALLASFLHDCTVSPSHSAEPMMAVGWKNIQHFRQWQTATAYKDRLKLSLSVISLYVSSRHSSFCWLFPIQECLPFHWQTALPACLCYVGGHHN